MRAFIVAAVARRCPRVDDRRDRQGLQTLKVRDLRYQVTLWSKAQGAQCVQAHNRDFLAESTGPETRDDLGWQRHAADPARIIRITPGPNPGFHPLDRELLRDQQPMQDVEARIPKFADRGFNIDNDAVGQGLEKPCFEIDDRKANYIEARRNLARFRGQHFLKQHPGAVVKKFEEPAVKYDARRITMCPRDGDLVSTNEIRHGTPLALAYGRNISVKPAPAQAGTF
jgi:hypothetical protein